MYQDLANAHKVKANFIFWGFAFTQYFLLSCQLTDKFKILFGLFCFVFLFFGRIIEDSVRALSLPDCWNVIWQYS